MIGQVLEKLLQKQILMIQIFNRKEINKLLDKPLLQFFMSLLSLLTKTHQLSFQLLLDTTTKTTILYSISHHHSNQKEDRQTSYLIRRSNYLQQHHPFYYCYYCNIISKKKTQTTKKVWLDSQTRTGQPKTHNDC